MYDGIQVRLTFGSCIVCCHLVVCPDCICQQTIHGLASRELRESKSGLPNVKPDQTKERVFSYVHDVTSALTAAEPYEVEVDPKLVEQWKHANKVAKEIWDNMNNKYTVEDATKQKFVGGNYLRRWQMTGNKEIKAQINEYHKLLEELKAKKINLPEFVVGTLVEKLPSSWNDYKQQLKHKHGQMSLADLIKHIIIEDTNKKECDAA
ncbi:hypothetical protein L195_g004040 [Trifolium pratense]|uniref:Uncharacterized protein n=1 Tax=Trifolium pratense TaxID=57577 RepID=A0A2K3NWX6_TRIPR|nr:hypothetical protein L195_g004040 [Trifolium pratense]